MTELDVQPDRGGDLIAHPEGWLAGLTERVKPPAGDGTAQMDVTEASITALAAAAMQAVSADESAHGLNLTAAREAIAGLAHQARLAVAHDRQPYPTADAYRAVCTALEARKARLDVAEARLARVVAVLADLDQQPTPAATFTADGETAYQQALAYTVERLRDVLSPDRTCRCTADYKSINAHKAGCPADDRPLVKQLRQAIAEPGSVVGCRRGPSWRKNHPAYAEEPETVPAWSARAVLVVLGVGVEQRRG
ncbi:hypothetical protein [Phytohabitans houttuyneae]|uniref:Uncharacterized protein n=1 Tax=Phytohabitans houttuyneae TaxID=1076126 RepID=A0A6V8KFM9_9ACTN|nr:hypothetical protein [Phytohabitans houttuyneae]GFJ79535.1 hypothetical protein Phou_037150 [Phytohabitans houttuyneae]